MKGAESVPPPPRGIIGLNLKLFWTKVDVKSVIRDYLLRNYVVNV